MALKSVQFQPGISMFRFQEQYGTEEKCREALLKWRWPRGYVCPMCGCSKGCEIKRRRLYQCNQCHHQTSLTAGTIFDSTKLSLRVWFLAMYIMTQTKNGTSTLEMARHLGVTYTTAWRLRHKLMEVMYMRNENMKLKGNIEMDDSYLGGQRSGCKRGRGAPGKIPFIAAVEKNKQGHPVYVKLARLDGFRKEEIEKWSVQNLSPGSKVVTDGLNCFTGVKKSGCLHTTKRVGSHRQAVLEPSFHWVNTVLGNLKNSLRGTFHVVHPKYSHRYLAEFQYRFNRRFDLSALIARLAYVSLRTTPRPEWLLKLAEI